MNQGATASVQPAETTKLNEHLNRWIQGTTNLPAAENATGAKLESSDNYQGLTLPAPP